MFTVEFKFELGEDVVNVPTGKHGSVRGAWIDYDSIIYFLVRTVSDTGSMQFDWLREEDVLAA